MNVRYPFILIIFLFLCFQSVFSQTFNAGVGGGLTVSEINGANTDPSRRGFHKLGVHAGGVANFKVAKQTLFQFEINYIQKGSMQPPDSLNNGYYKILLGYIEIPLLLRQQIFFNWKGRRINKFDLELGASYGKMFHRTVVGNTNYQLNNTEPYYNTNDISLLAGLDYNFTNNICFNFRYSNSLIPAVKRNTLVNGLISQTFNRGNNMVFQFGFKFLFTTKRRTATTSDDSATPPAN